MKKIIICLMATILSLFIFLDKVTGSVSQIHRPFISLNQYTLQADVLYSRAGEFKIIKKLKLKSEEKRNIKRDVHSIKRRLKYKKKNHDTCLNVYSFIIPSLNIS
jgi:hypothetical protein